MIRQLTAMAALVLAAPAHAHDPLEVGGSRVHILLDAAATGGSMGMFSITETGPSGPPRHIHDDADEAFFVVDGAFEILAGEDMVVVEEGGAAFAPKGAVHTFRATEEDGGTILVIVAPGGFEGFFRQVAEEGLVLPDDMERFTEISSEFHQRMAGPPLGAE